MTCTIISTGFEKQLTCKNELEKPYSDLKRTLWKKICEAYSMGYTTFYVNSKYSIPLWAAESICILKQNNLIKLYIVIPYEEQSKNWIEEHRNRYFTVHEKAAALPEKENDCFIDGFLAIFLLRRFLFRTEKPCPCQVQCCIQGRSFCRLNTLVFVCRQLINLQ